MIFLYDWIIALQIYLKEKKKNQITLLGLQ